MKDENKERAIRMKGIQAAQKNVSRVG